MEEYFDSRRCYLSVCVCALLCSEGSIEIATVSLYQKSQIIFSIAIIIKLYYCALCVQALWKLCG